MPRNPFRCRRRTAREEGKRVKGPKNAAFCRFHRPRAPPPGIPREPVRIRRIRLPGFFLVPGPRPRPRRVSDAAQPLGAAAVAGSKGCRDPADFAERRGAKCTMGRLGSRGAKRWRGNRPVCRPGELDKEWSDRALREVHAKAGHTGLEDRRGNHVAQLPRFRSGAGWPLVQTWFKGNAGEFPASGLHRLCGSAVCSNGGVKAPGGHMGVAIHGRAAPGDVFSGRLWFRAPAEQCLPATRVGRTTDERPPGRQWSRAVGRMGACTWTDARIATGPIPLAS